MRLSVEQIEKVWKDSAERFHGPMHRRRLYYDGEHAILSERIERLDGRPPSRLVTNWVRHIVDQQVGFLTSRPVDYTAEDSSGLASVRSIRDLYRLNELDVVDAENLECALLYGFGVEFHWFDGVSDRVLYSDPRKWAFVFNSDGLIESAIYRTVLPRWSVYRGQFLESDLVLWRVWDGDFERRYIGGFGDGGLKPSGRAIRHYYGVPPVVLFPVNESFGSHITDALLTEQDAYNRVRSANSDDVLYNVDQLLALTGYDVQSLFQPIVDEGDSREGSGGARHGRTQADMIRETRMIPLAAQGDAKFIEKGNSVEKVAHELGLSRDAIHMMGGIPDLHKIVGASGTVSGIALKLKYAIQCQVAEGFCKHFTAALRRRLDLINVVREKRRLAPFLGFDVTITRNVPVNEAEILQNIPNMRQVMSLVDILRGVPSVEDPEGAAARKKEELRDPLLSGVEIPKKGKD